MADVTITAASVKPDSDAVTGTGTAGVAITAGQVVYLNRTTGKLELADADVLTSSKVAGIALNNAALDQPVTYQTGGTINIGGTVVVGTVYVASPTAGGVAPWADLLAADFVSILGVASTTGKIKLAIFNTDIAKA